MRGRNLSVALVAVAAVALAWLYLAPSQLGGGTVYSTIDGISMQPLLHRGDLVLTRPQSDYRVGQIVLYRSTVLGRTVLHRIVAIKQGHYYFKGDNNDFVDPAYATRSELLGLYWFKVPHAGAFVGWMRAPLHTALLTGAAIFLLLGLGSTAGRRRARRRAPPPRPDSRRRPAPRRLRQGPAALAAVVAFLAGLVFLVVGFGNSTARIVERSGAYAQTGAFSYDAHARPDAVYPTGTAKTGQPVLFARFKRLTVRFRYAFDGPARDVHGTIAMRALISSDSSWHELATVVPRQSFRGSTAAVSGSVDLVSLRALITQLSIDTGTVGGTYEIVLRPIVHVQAVVHGSSIEDTFVPTLQAEATQTLLRLAPVAAPIGASIAAPSQAEQLVAELHPREVGSLPASAANYVTIARYRLGVRLVRILGGVGAILGLIAVLFTQFGRRRDVWAEDVRIAFRNGVSFVDVSELALGVGEDATVVDDLDGLARLARQADRPILRLQSEQSTIYVLGDGERTFVFRGPASISARPVDRPRPAQPALPKHAPRGRRLLHAAGIGMALVVLVGAGVSFTAGNVLPPSYAGTSVQALAISQLTPLQCVGMNLTDIIFAPASGTINGTAGNDLIIGRTGSGSITYNGQAGNDCIVAGGGPTASNTITGGPGTDVCIGGPNAQKNTFSGCETTYN
ncbi:MAG TPA: signal peptidase I [Gaiellaceae bacterium]|nr:signal peptidase I [Gaiellaceae bacterium]